MNHELLHEFDSSMTCNYCGIAEGKTQMHDQCPIRVTQAKAKAAAVKTNHPRNYSEGKMDTEAIDKLFLELSQFTRAKTKRELALEAKCDLYAKYASYCRSCALSGEHDPQELHEFIKTISSTV